MATITRQMLDSFFTERRLAVIGASRNPKKYGGMLFRALRERGYEALPVNPHAEVIDGVPACASLEALPTGVTHAIAVVPASEQSAVVRACAAKGITTLWLHGHVMKGLADPEPIALAHQAGIQVITGLCPMMFLPDTSLPHRIHGHLLKLFGAYPK